MRSRRLLGCLVLSSSLAIAALPAVADGSTSTAGAEPRPGSAAYVARDLRNITDAYGRIVGPGGQLRNAAYLPALVSESSAVTAAQLVAQAASPTRLAITAGMVVPGWNVGNPLRAGWDGTRGRARDVAFTNRYGALLRGTIHQPMKGARDPYTGERLRGPFPGVVITPGSVQGSEGMYEWLAQDLAERGYVVLTYDVQGQGRSETLPHDNESLAALPFCNPFAPPRDVEMFGCPGVPFQQLSNFVVGTEDALDFFTSTPRHHYPNPRSAGAKVDDFNPFWRSYDASPDRRPATKGRTTRIAIIGHSMGARAVSQVQGTDRRVATIVALDKLSADADFAPGVPQNKTRPTVPALGIQSEYGFTVAPYFLAGGSGLVPGPSPKGPDPRREKDTGFRSWQRAGVDSMMLVPRASTHLEYTDIPLVLPASRYGQALTSAVTQRWLDHYLKHRGGVGSLLQQRLRYLEPVGNGRWQSISLRRDRLLSFYFCSAYALGDGRSRRADGDITGAGC
jgi:hypothetical protein